MTRGKNHRSGQAMIEFVLVGIPIIFLLISIFELSRGMWLYHTVAHAMREGARFAIVRGNNCNLYPNNCVVTIREIATRIKDAAVGIPATDLQDIVFDVYDSNGNSVIVVDDNGNPVVDSNGNPIGKRYSCQTLQDCVDNGAGTYWPANAPGAGEAQGAYQFFDRVEISGRYAFRSAIAMFWPGTKPGAVFGMFWFPASSREAIQY